MVAYCPHEQRTGTAWQCNPIMFPIHAAQRDILWFYVAALGFLASAGCRTQFVRRLEPWRKHESNRDRDQGGRGGCDRRAVHTRRVAQDTKQNRRDRP